MDSCPFIGCSYALDVDTRCICTSSNSFDRRTFSLDISRMFSSCIIVLITISGLVSSLPVKQLSFTAKSENVPLDQAFRDAEIVLNRYFHLMKSDGDHLIHGLLYVLMNNPTSFPFMPHRALDIALKGVESKLGRASVDTLTKPLLLAVEQNYLAKPQHSPAYQLTEETKVKIEDALDKFLEEDALNSHV